MDRKKIVAGLMVLLASLGAGGCKKQHALTVGSKNFTEQVILGEITAQHLENRLKRNVIRQLNMGGTLLVHTSLMNGQIDVYPEYTGTALQAVLKLTMVNDPKATFDRVRELYRSNLKLEWLDPLGFDNSFVMLVRRDDPAFAKINTLSDAERYTEGWQLGVGYEFEQRPDGLSTLNTFYRLNQPKAPVTMDLGLLYKALSQRQVNMAAANSTDGPLAVEPVKILKDDRHCFPPYQASLVVRQEALQSYPELKAALDELSGKFPEAAIRKLNYEVDVKHASPKDVAAGFLHDSGLRR